MLYNLFFYMSLHCFSPLLFSTLRWATLFSSLPFSVVPFLWPCYWKAIQNSEFLFETSCN